jgi:CheY-like chemotaxis protein
VEARQVIERQVAHLVRLIDDLLDISRISHGKVGLQPERVSLSSVVVSALEAARPLLTDRNHTLHVDLPSDPVFLHGDPVRLAQILTNLLSNAARYTEPGGKVVVETSCERGFAIVRVVDSGIGITAAELGDIFTMFNQAAAARAVDHMGLGIGLALAKQLTEMHGGTLTAASAGPGKGSAFTLQLPLEADLPEALQEQPAGPEVPTSPMRVLVVDDNVDAARTLAELLSLDGHETHLAHDGPSAVEAAYRVRPDAAIVDIGLPGFSGLEVAQRLREDPLFSGLFLVALSGWVQPEDLARSATAGFDHHLAKPVTLVTLERLLARIRPGAPGRLTG